MSTSGIVQALPYGVAGLAAGILYFSLLRINVRWYLEGSSRPRAIALHAARIGGIAALFWMLATIGALPLLLGLAGFLVARMIGVRWSEKTP